MSEMEVDHMGDHAVHHAATAAADTQKCLTVACMAALQ